jgi:cytoplasmic iron level regulating protein YaaA (DUF328/UPF0246 family)
MDTMEWNEVKDPSGDIEFIGNWYVVADGSYSPEDIQDLIIKNGVFGMVKEVNDLLRNTQHQGTLKLTNKEGKHILTRTYVEAIDK